MSAAQLRDEERHIHGPDKAWSRPDYDNSGDGPLRVPGFGGLPVDLEHKPEERFANGSHDWAQPRLTAREMTMLRVMNDVTDVNGWQDMLDDEATLRELRPSTYVAPLLSDLAWQWCVRELHDMAKLLRDAGHVRVFESASCVIKCDLLRNDPFLAACQQQLEPLVREALQTQPFLDDVGLAELDEDLVEEDRLFHDKSTVLELVDPALCPLIYGRTRVLSRGGRVDLSGTLDFKDWGEISDVHDRGLSEPAELFKFDDNASGIEPPFYRRCDARLHRASDRFQWLPFEVEFPQESNGTDVRITSYINNLQPMKHRELYQTIETIISRAVPTWNEVLASTRHFQQPPRIRTYGVSWVPPFPDWAYDLEEGATDSQRRVAEQKAEGFLKLPDPATRSTEPTSRLSAFNDKMDKLQKAVVDKYKSLKTHWNHPEPGGEQEYQEWRAGITPKPLIPRSFRARHSDQLQFGRPLPRQKVSLENDFRNLGLQVVVRVFSIELNAENPVYNPANKHIDTYGHVKSLTCPHCDRDYLEDVLISQGAGDWYFDGMLNEHIVATTTVCISNENASPFGYLLRVEGDLHHMEQRYEPGQFEELAATYEIWPPLGMGGDDPTSQALQILGRVDIPQGRSLTIPSSIQREVAAPVKLLDQARPGHVRLIQLYLVDPHYRICSTRNVPPQQRHWWRQAARLHDIDWAKAELPQEIVDDIMDSVDEADWPMGMEEAAKHRAHRLAEELVARHAADGGVARYDFF